MEIAIKALGVALSLVIGVAFMVWLNTGWPLWLVIASGIVIGLVVDVIGLILAKAS